MKKRIYAGVLLFVLNSILLAQSKLAKDEYSIYSVVLHLIYPVPVKDPKSFFLIMDKTDGAYIRHSKGI
jgi:hypothetical protein